MRSFFLNSYDSTPLFVRVWDEVALPKGLVLVCHGIGEHGGRYQELAHFLQSKNLVTVVYDQRCFGASARPEALGHGTSETWGYSVNDLVFLYRYYAREYKLPMFVFGHGYGAYLAMAAMQQGIVKPKAVIASGIGILHAAALRVRLSVLAGLPQKDKVALPYRQAENSWAGKMANGTSWRTNEAELAKSFETDPMCGVTPTVGLAQSIDNGLLNILKEENIAAMDRGVKYAIFAGMDDPCLGKMGEDAIELLLEMRKLQFGVRFFGYEGARHDIWQEKLRNRYMQHLHRYILTVL